MKPDNTELILTYPGSDSRANYRVSAYKNPHFSPVIRTIPLPLGLANEVRSAIEELGFTEEFENWRVAFELLHSEYPYVVIPSPEYWRCLDERV